MPRKTYDYDESEVRSFIDNIGNDKPLREKFKVATCYGNDIENGRQQIESEINAMDRLGYDLTTITCDNYNGVFFLVFKARDD